MAAPVIASVGLLELSAGEVNMGRVTVQVVAAGGSSEISQIALRNSTLDAWSDWLDGTESEWLLVPGNGTRVVYAKARNVGLEESSSDDTGNFELDVAEMTRQLIENMIPVYKNAGLLPVLMAAFASALNRYRYDFLTAKDMLNPLLSRGRWLARWGASVNLLRYDDEENQAYANRVAAEVTKERSTRLSVYRAALSRVTAGTLRVTEYPGGAFVEIDLSSATYSSLTEVREAVGAVRPAGIKVVYRT